MVDRNTRHARGGVARDTTAACCTADEREVCCSPSEKTDCCGTGAGSCGCR